MGGNWLRFPVMVVLRIAGGDRNDLMVLISESIVVIIPIVRACTMVSGATDSWQSMSTSSGSLSAPSVLGMNPNSRIVDCGI